jgi:predicted transcriptional regulator
MTQRNPFYNRSKFEAVLSILESISKNGKNSRRSLESEIHMSKPRVKLLLEYLCKRGFLECSESFKYRKRDNVVSLTFFGMEWLKKARLLMAQLEL